MSLNKRIRKFTGDEARNYIQMTEAGNLKIVKIWALNSLLKHLNSFVEEIVLSGITLKNPERVKRAIIIFFSEKKKKLKELCSRTKPLLRAAILK